MTRGRKPLIALREAGQIARKRGDTRHFMHEPGMICNFVIYCMGFVAHVRIKRVTRLRCTHAVIEREAAEALSMLRAIASGPGISRELWVYLPRGSFRFFRVTDTGLVELERDGTVMPEKTRPVIQAPPALAGPATSSPLLAPPGEFSVVEETQEKSNEGP
jgi:hypothetical protein